MILSEEDRLRLQLARFSGQGFPQELIDQILQRRGDPHQEDSGPARIARGQVLQTGKVTATATELGLVGDIVDFTPLGAIQDGDRFLAPLVGRSQRHATVGHADVDEHVPHGA